MISNDTGKKKHVASHNESHKGEDLPLFALARCTERSCLLTYCFADVAS